MLSIFHIEYLAVRSQSQITLLTLITPTDPNDDNNTTGAKAPRGVHLMTLITQLTHAYAAPGWALTFDNSSLSDNVVVIRSRQSCPLIIDTKLDAHNSAHTHCLLNMHVRVTGGRSSVKTASVFSVSPSVFFLRDCKVLGEP